MLRREPGRSEVVANATIAGGVAAMAMTGMRAVTVRLGLLRRPPPDEVVKETAPKLLARAPVDPEVVVELAHWGYGAAAGAAFGMLPRSLRLAPWAGPAYGAAIWELFELAVAPLLGLRRADERTTTERAAILADHVLYGAIVGSRTRALS